MSFVNLRPNATTTNDGVPVVPSGDAHDALNDDPDNDSTYCGFRNENDKLVLALDNLSLPAGSVIKGVLSWLRSSNASQPCVVSVDVPQVPGMAQWVNINWINPATHWVRYREDFTLTDALIDGATLVVTQISGTGVGMNLYEAGVTVLYVAQADVFVYPPAALDENLPLIRWDNVLDPDGGPQTLYEVRVFTDSQYGAGGFNPASSTPTASSGQVAGGDHTWTVDTPLPDDTYRAYVRIAQTVNGELLWSEFRYSQFTIDAANPAIPEIAVSADDDLGRIQIDLTDVAGGDVATTQFQVERSDDGGQTWASLRSLLGDGLVDVGDGTVTVYDYEAPNGGEVLYRARTFGGSNVSDWVEADDEVSWSSQRQWFKHPTNPALNLTVTFISQPGHARAARQGEFQALGSRNVVVVADTRGPRRGSLQVMVAPDDLEAFDEMLASGLPILVQTPATQKWGSRWVSIGDEDVTRMVDRAWSEEDLRAMSWVEVNRPAGELVSWE